MSEGRADITALALGWVGTPYRHQASVRGVGADCLGLVRGVWRDLYGTEPESLPAYTPDWSETGGIEALWSGARRHLVELPGCEGPFPGDVLLFRMRQGRVAKHLGLAVGAGDFVHAYSGHGVVRSALTAPWRQRMVARFQFPGEGTTWPR